MKTVRAVEPFIYVGGINFKQKPYNVLVKLMNRGHIAPSHYPLKIFHGLVFKFDFPRLFTNRKEARLRFVQPWSLSFDTWPDYMFFEIIPFFWDVWPDNFECTCQWLKKYDVRTAIFTSSQVADMIKGRFLTMNVMWCPEGIDTETYTEGKALKERTIDFFEYGRNIDSVVKYEFKDNYSVVRGQNNGKNTLRQNELLDCLTNAKVVPCYTKNWTSPTLGGDIETLTQRYWECMLSRVVMIGHCPKELIDIIGYNPVIEIDTKDPNSQLDNVLNHICDYQNMVDKNRETALRYGSWKVRMKDVQSFLKSCGYEC